MKIVDLSAPIVASPEDTLDVLRTDIEFSDHAEGAEVIKTLFGVGPELLRDGEGWANEFFTRFGTHNSTHVDAPYHYNSTIDGEPAQTIEQLPLEWFVSDGVVLDFDGREDGDAIGAADVEAALSTAGHEIKPLDVVLVRTGCDRWIDTAEYMAHGPGVTAEATHWLYDRGVRVMGIDAWGWDRPTLDAGAGGDRVRRAGHLLGSPPGRPRLFPDRTPRQPRLPAPDRLHRLLPSPAPGGRKRGSGPGRGDDRRQPRLMPAATSRLRCCHHRVMNFVEEEDVLLIAALGLVAGAIGFGTAERPCNGSVELCGRTLDQVVLPGTHNSMNAAEPNQRREMAPAEPALLDPEPASARSPGLPDRHLLR